jgi:MoxR-like ATPase
MATDSSTGYRYQPVFEPKGDVTDVAEGTAGPLKYCWRPEVKLVVNVALATGRALLLQGEPGVGKTVVAEAVAQELGWRFYRHTISSRTEAQDLTWKLDYVRRLADAQAGSPKGESAYLIPGQFWWAFDPGSAARQGGPRDSAPTLADPFQVNQTRSLQGAVVLIDEIDKADPAVANDLLETVGAGRFTIDGIAQPISVEWTGGGAPRADGAPSDLRQKGGLLIVFTSNSERDLPEAFLRRCIVERMVWPSPDDPENRVPFELDLRRIAQQNWARLGDGEPASAESPDAEKLIKELIAAIWAQRDEHKRAERRPPGLAELLDAIRACRELGVRPGDDRWEILSRVVWRKG